MDGQLRQIRSAEFLFFLLCSGFAFVFVFDFVIIITNFFRDYLIGKIDISLMSPECLIFIPRAAVMPVFHGTSLFPASVSRDTPAKLLLLYTPTQKKICQISPHTTMILHFTKTSNHFQRLRQILPENPHPLSADYLILHPKHLSCPVQEDVCCPPDTSPHAPHRTADPRPSPRSLHQTHLLPFSLQIAFIEYPSPISASCQTKTYHTINTTPNK